MMESIQYKQKLWNIWQKQAAAFSFNVAEYQIKREWN